MKRNLLFVWNAQAILTLLVMLVSSSHVTIRDLYVPSSPWQRSNATLRCEYDLGSETLYSVKWYKDDMEFLRYVPSDEPSLKYFPVMGVHIDVSHSNGSAVHLLQLSVNSSGVYSCEVSTDAPTFRTVTATKRMDVVDKGYLHITVFRVPGEVLAGANVILRCEFDLGNKKLHYVKWYKDEKEFFRYVPANKPPVQYFPASGLHVDVSRSNENAVYLRNVSLQSSGEYTCDVMTDAPEFDEVRQTKRMNVIGGFAIRYLHVPSSTWQGENATLWCNYDLGSEALYSVKWYKDNMEFLRYIPSLQYFPPLQYFPVKGVHIDDSHSNGSTVHLIELSVNSSGDYSCEVSAGAPSFRQTTVSKRMEVVDQASDVVNIQASFWSLLSFFYF